jgi:hypothetical protein
VTYRARAFVLCATVAISGCAAASGVTGTAPPAITARPVVSASQLSLPLEAYELTLGQEVTAARAVTVLADRCLRGFGLPPPSGLLGHAEPPAAEVTESAVQWLGAASAEVYGFNPPPDSALREFDSLNVGGAIYSTDAQVHEVLSGTLADGGTLTRFAGRPVPEGGCLGLATSEISLHIDVAAASGYSSTGAHQVPGAPYFWLVWPGLPLRLEEQAVENTEADSRAIAVASRWHACMGSAGFNYATPLDAMSDPRWAPGTSDASSQVTNHRTEIAVAIADAHCQSKVNFAGVRLALLTGYEDQLLRTHVGPLDAYRRAAARLMGNATAILEGRTPLPRDGLTGGACRWSCALQGKLIWLAPSPGPASGCRRGCRTPGSMRRCRPPWRGSRCWRPTRPRST